MKCNMCVYYPKCKEIPVEENCCEDFKDSMMFVELPFMVNQLVFYIEPATKYEPVIIDGAAYFKLVDDSKVKCRLFDGDALEEYLKPTLPFMERRVKKYFATKAEADQALAEAVKKNG